MGKLIPLHGLETILAAARLVPELTITVAGGGQLDSLLEARPPNVEWVPWIEYEQSRRLLPGSALRARDLRHVSEGRPRHPEQGLPGDRLRHAGDHRGHAGGAGAPDRRRECAARPARRPRGTRGSPEASRRGPRAPYAHRRRRPGGLRAARKRGRARPPLARGPRGSGDEAQAPPAQGTGLGRDGRVCGGVHLALGPPPSRVQHWALRPRQHRPGDLDDGAWPRLPPADQPPRRADLAARIALRADPGRVRASLAHLAEPGHARNRPGARSRERRAPRLLARPQAPPLRAGRVRARARLPDLSAAAVARARRVPPRRTRLSAAALRVLVPGRRPARAVRRLCSPRVHDARGDAADRGRDGALVRAQAPELQRSGSASRRPGWC